MTDVITVADQEWNCIVIVIAKIFVLHSNTGDGDDRCRDWLTPPLSLPCDPKETCASGYFSLRAVA